MNNMFVNLRVSWRGQSGSHLWVSYLLSQFFWRGIGVSINPASIFFCFPLLCDWLLLYNAMEKFMSTQMRMYCSFSPCCYLLHSVRYPEANYKKNLFFSITEGTIQYVHMECIWHGESIKLLGFHFRGQRETASKWHTKSSVFLKISHTIPD